MLGGELTFLRGVGAQPWKRLGQLGAPTADLDGDGICDLVRGWGDGTLLAASGANGHELWRSAVRSISELGVKPAGWADSYGDRTGGDLDGDGVVDLLVWDRFTGGRGRITPLHAVSGRTGRKLWTVPDVGAEIIGGMLAAASRDLDADGTDDVLWLAALDHGYPDRFAFSPADAQLWLFVASGQTGRLKWSQPLSPQYGLQPGVVPPLRFQDVELSLECADLDGDSALDLLVPAATAGDRMELQAQRQRRQTALASPARTRWTVATIAGELDHSDGRRPGRRRAPGGHRRRTGAA